MNILMFNYEFPPLGGGTGRANYEILKTLEKVNVQGDICIHLITSSVNTFRIEEFSPNITIHYLNIGKKGSLHAQKLNDLGIYSYKSYWYAKKIMKKIQFDFIHAFFGIPCGYTAMKLGLPYIVSLRGSDVPFHNPKYKLMYKHIFQRLSKKIWAKAKFATTNSEGLMEEAHLTSPKQSFEIIPNGIHIDEFRPAKAQPYSGNLILITTGRLAKHKGIGFLIKALEGIDDVELILAGDGPDKEEFECLAEVCKVNVKFMGIVPHDRIPSILRLANVYVLPSLNEGMSNSMIEAMATGLPIIATRVGGVKELIRENGIIVEKGSVEALKTAILHYKNNSILMREHGIKSREIALELSWEKNVRKHIELYNKMILK